MTDVQQKNIYAVEEDSEQSSFNFQKLYTIFILNWKWFVLSIIIGLGCSYLYLRYKSPVYATSAKLLIKDDSNNKSASAKDAISGMVDFGIISSNYGVDNEIEILNTRTLAAEAVRDLKLYTSYWKKGRVKNVILYKNQPINVDVDAAHLEKLNAPISMSIERDENKYIVKGKYYVSVDETTVEGPFKFEKTLAGIPATIMTKAGTLFFTSGKTRMKDGDVMKVVIVSPMMMAAQYSSALSLEQTSKTSTTLNMQLNDKNIQRGIDYLRQLVICYNRQANEDKNEIAIRTEAFVNDRLEKINSELNSTEGQLENYKKRNRLVELKVDAKESVTNLSSYEQKLNEAATQISLINSLIQFAERPGNKYQVLPSNIGLRDEASISLINDYNKVALERNRLLRTASESSPVVEELTSQLKDMNSSIRMALSQAKRNLEIQRNAVASQYGQYNQEVSRTPEQERILTQIGRQQEVKSGLYLMLLQKREENSISLAATADKGKLVELPQYVGKVSPKTNIILLLGLILGIAIPSLVLYLLQFFRYRIEGHDDVESLTDIPIIADVAVANEAAKTRADIVVHENENNQMEEIFRSMRTNLQFMMKPEDKVVMFTSSTSGEGKTFNAANLAISFALLGKKVVLVGLDIRKPRLAELFEIDNHHTGITKLLVKDDPTWNDVQKEILPSEINKNLDLLMAGPIPPNPGEIVTRPSLEKVLNLLKENYDYILVDTAPVGLVTDTLQIGKLVDATVFMCRADYTPKAAFNAINMFKAEKKLKNMAIVINGIDMSKKKYGYYYGVGKYGRYRNYGSYSKYGNYTSYGTYGNKYGNANDNSLKLK
ncbi:polysaccharide biosynthesis tyrosine autokinase [uncultured Prevotella sp.]|uniref:exopolysaccharide transport family protein n=1 Tax=uncultured Prevotella sp. TaxID=159272 RepID=UPI00261BA804|nr:polysaccharide biosynthesis tyrosine autokinase [uncultured Prevotella sp.]